MKLPNCLLGILIMFGLMISIGCGDSENPADATKQFNPEYDYVEGYDIFTGSTLSDIQTQFRYAKTNFSPYPSDEIFGGGYLRNIPEILAFVMQHAECFLDENGDCVPLYTDMNKLYHRSYLAGVINDGGTDLLGTTLNNGQEFGAICIIYVETIRNFADNVGKPEQSIMEFTVLHELGHGRANLLHLCNGYEVNSDHHWDPSSAHTCVMINGPTSRDCLDPDDASPLDPMGYCGTCKENLKTVTW